jgi:hypothetical protein
MRRVKLIGLSIIVVIAITLAVGIAGSLIHVSWAYCVECEVIGPSENDEHLAEWLRSQPGVVPNTVHLKRRGPDQKLLQISFIQSRNYFGRPAFPALEEAAHSMGYTGDNIFFHDCRNRYNEGPVKSGEAH